MSQLACKTRGNVSPQGKPRVFFCCHPADFAVYFEEIAAEILALQNCALFYAEGGGVTVDEELLSDLGQMQLFVMPVTTRLLTTDNAALARLFPFAMEHHVPVLPLMQEEGLDGLFNQKCGDLQYLDKNAADNTAIPYEEKLGKYLDGVLVGDELAAKVRAAFDAYVFLSYRKKDRRHAQELMRLIHANDFCRDIAIWYDEFLTPGENFNEAIRQALEKSGLFVLAVTPNLVNEPNYIQQIEYPLAVEQGKPVLPAEMVPTSPAELADKYPALPPCADAHDAPALSAALLEAVRRMAKRENDGSPEHDFFIGLAYLSGIDVEVDHGRALALITSAAEAGLEEAMQKLVDMYRQGLGVRRDYEAALAWKRRLVELKEAAYVASSDEDTADRLLYELTDWADYLEELRRFEQAREAYQYALAVCDAFPNETVWYVRYCRLSLGGICDELGQETAALEQYRAALQAAQRYAEEQDTVDSWMDVADSHRSLGKQLADADGFSEALEQYEAALTVSRRLAEQENTLDAWMDVARLYLDMGEVLGSLGQNVAAYERMEQAQDIGQRILAQENTPSVKRFLFHCYTRWGLQIGRMGREEEALEKQLRGHALAAEVAEQTELLSDKENLAACMDNLFEAYKELGRVQEGEECLRKGLAMRQELAALGETAQIQRALYASYYYLHICMRAKGDDPSAIEWMKKGVALLERLTEETDALQDWKRLAEANVCLGELYRREGRTKEAVGCFTEALALFERCLHSRNSANTREGLARMYRQLSGCYCDENDFGTARDSLRRALELEEALCREGDALAYRYGLQNTYCDLAELEKTLGNLSAAQESFSRALDVLESLEDGRRTRLAKAQVYSQLGEIAYELEDWQTAREWAERAVAILRQENEESKEEIVHHNLSVAYFRLGRILLKQEEPEEALEYFQTALNLDMETSRKLGTVTASLEVYATMQGIWIAYYFAGYRAFALSLVEEACETVRHLSELTDGNVRFREKVADSLRWRGNILSVLERPDEAGVCYRQARQVYEELPELSVDLQNDYGETLYNLGVVTDKPEKLELWERALAVWTALAEQCPEMDSYTRRCRMCREALENYA